MVDSIFWYAETLSNAAGKKIDYVNISEEETRGALEDQDLYDRIKFKIFSDIIGNERYFHVVVSVVIPLPCLSMINSLWLSSRSESILSEFFFPVVHF
jgi:hypothetical protein